MLSILESLFGTYTPVTYESVSSTGALIEVIPNGLSGVDWPYILGVFLFAICLYSVFRILGVILSRV